MKISIVRLRQPSAAPYPSFRRLLVRSLLLAVFSFSGISGCSLNAKLEADPRLAHFADSSPALGQMARQLSATDLHGLPVELDDLLDGRPLVLQLGSASCPVFRYRRFGMESLVEDFGERVRFVVVYTVEAHPVGSPSVYADGEEWDPWINRLAGSRVRAAEFAEDRLAQARRTRHGLKLQQEVLVDTTDDATWRSYGGAPSAAFVLDASGRVIERQMWVRPKLLRRVLEDLVSLESFASAIERDDLDTEASE